MRTLLLRRLAPLLAVLAVVATSCGSVESPAVTVNGEEISTDALQEELKTIRSNQAYREVLESPESGYGIELAGEGDGTFSAAFTAQVLSLRAYYELLEQALADAGVEVDDAALEQVRPAVEQSLESLGEDVLERFPRDYREKLVRREAVINLAAQESAGDVEVACVSHILITTESRSAEEAKRLIDEIEAQLEAGADFAEVAQARSEDPGSKDAGGDLGCSPPGRYVPEFDEAAFNQPVGEIGEPVQTDFGYHLILVESREQGGEGAGTQESLNAYLRDVICGDDVEVDVNPRYGRWDASACAEGGLASVVPPRTVGGE